MLNTNGIRISKDESFAAELKKYTPDFEIYLQFDSFKKEALEHLRGKDLRDVRSKAIEYLNKYNISTTLVVTLEKGINTDEIGEIIEYALKQRYVRGVTFQPTQVAGRLDTYNHTEGRYTLTDVRKDILKQTNIFSENDIIPVPCNPDALAMAYALKIDDKVFPLTNMINPDDLLNNSGNTIVYEQDERLKSHLLRMFSTGNAVEKITEDIKSIMCCLPNISAPNLNYENIFRIIIMQFIDAHNFDVRAVKKSCVHIVNKDGK